MLHVATNDQERKFLRPRKVGKAGLTERDIYILDSIVQEKDPNAVCHRCGSDHYYIEGGNSYASWCENPVCKTRSVVRGI